MQAGGHELCTWIRRLSAGYMGRKNGLGGIYEKYRPISHPYRTECDDSPAREAQIQDQQYGLQFDAEESGLLKAE
jgi:hypothetical protein